MYYYSKKFNTFKEGIEALATISYSANQAMSHSSPESVVPGHPNLRELVEISLIRNTIQGSRVSDKWVYYETNGGVEFGWSEDTSSFVFFIGFYREGSIIQNAKELGFTEIEEDELFSGDYKETRNRIFEFCKDLDVQDDKHYLVALDEILKQHQLTRKSLSKLPYYVVKVESFESSTNPFYWIERELEDEKLKYPCLFYFNNEPDSSSDITNELHLIISPTNSIRLGANNYSKNINGIMEEIFGRLEF